MNRKCKFENPNGSQCRRWANRGSDFCYHHQPELSTESVATPELATTEDLLAVISDTLNAARHGRIAPGQAYAVGQLAQLWLQVRKEIGFEKGREELAQFLPALMSGDSEDVPQLESADEALELPAPPSAPLLRAAKSNLKLLGGEPKT